MLAIIITIIQDVHPEMLEGTQLRQSHTLKKFHTHFPGVMMGNKLPQPND